MPVATCADDAAASDEFPEIGGGSSGEVDEGVESVDDKSHSGASLGDGVEEGLDIGDENFIIEPLRVPTSKSHNEQINSDKYCDSADADERI